MPELYQKSTSSVISEPLSVGRDSMLEGNLSESNPVSPSLHTPSSYDKRSSHRALWITVFTILALILLGLFGAIVARNIKSKPTTVNQKASDSYATTNISLNNLIDNNLDDTQSQLDINGKLVAKDGFVISPTAQPANSVVGQFYVNNQTNQAYYYDGNTYNQIITTNSAVTSVQGQIGSVTLQAGSGININGTTIGNDGVISVGGTNGAINLGQGLGIANSTIFNTGVIGINGTPDQVIVSSSNGTFSLSLPQDLAVGSSPSFASVSLGTPLSVSSGGTGISTNPTNGQLLIGNGSGYSLSTLTAGTNISITNTPGGITIDASGSGSVGSVGALDGQPKSVNGAVILGNDIYMQTADNTNPGLVSTGIQTFAGDKTFSGNTLIKPVSNSALAFNVQNISSDSLLKVDTTNGRVVIGDDPGLTGAKARLYFGDPSNSNVWIGEQATIDTNILQLQGKNGLRITTSGAPTDVITIDSAGATTFKNISDSSTAFSIQDAGGVALLTADTLNHNIAVRAASDTLPVLTVLNSAGLASLEIRSSSDQSNAFVGISSGEDNTASGVFNSAFGNQSLKNNTTGDDNTAVGYQSLQTNTVGSGNTALGSFSLLTNSSGVSNTALGHKSLQMNSTGAENTATGYYSLKANTSGFYNTANGYQSLLANTTGVKNAAFGADNLKNNITGSYNVALGHYTLVNNDGNNNVAIGDEAGTYDYDGAGTSGVFLQPVDLENSSAIGGNAISQKDHSLILGNIGTGTYDAGIRSGQSYIGIGTTKPDSLFSVSPVYYDTGMASQSTTIITGVGTTWTASMVGMELIYADGSSATITGFTDATHLSASGDSQTAANQSYRIHTGGLQVSETDGFTTQYGNLTVQAIPNTFDNLLSIKQSSGLEASYFTYTGELKLNTSLSTRNSNSPSTNSNTLYISSGDADGVTSNSGNVDIDTGTATGTAGSVELGNANASAVNIGRVGIITTNNSNQLTNNGSTLNTAQVLSDYASGGAIGVASTTVDINTSFTIAQTTTGQTLSIPNPTNTASAGRIIYIANIGTASFNIGSNTIAAGSSAAYIWSGITFGWNQIGSSSGNGSYIQNGTAVQTANFNVQSTSAGSIGAIIQGAAAQTADIFQVKADGVANPVFSINSNGQAVHRNSTDGTALAVQRAAGGDNVFSISTSGNQVKIGNNAGAAAGDTSLLILDNAPTTAQPAGSNGGMYYDTTTNKFKCFQASIWTDCITTDTGVTTVGTFSGSSQPNGATISGNTITFGPADATNPGLVSTTAQTIAGDKTFNDNILGASTATGTTATTTGTGTNTTTLTFTGTTSFANNDVLYIDNAGQDYYTRIVSGGSAASVTVSPAVTFETTRTVTKYNIQNLGATDTDYTTLSNRFFQGYFTGGIVTGAGSTVYSDANISSTNNLKIATTGVNVQNTADSTSAFVVQNVAGTAILNVDTLNERVGIGTINPQSLLSVNIMETPDLAAQLAVNTHGFTNKGLVVQGSTGQTANLFEAQTNVGGVLASIGATGQVLFKNSADSTTAFQIQTAAGTTFVNADSTNQQLSVRNKTDAAVLGSDIAAPATGAGFNWTGTGPYTHITGATNQLTFSSPAITSATTYEITYTTTGTTSGQSFTPTIGGVAGVPIYGNVTNETQLITTTGTGSLLFTPTSNATGTITLVTLKIITNNTSALAVKDSTGTVRLEVRAVDDNLALGRYSLQSNVSGGGNTAVGSQSLQSNTTGGANTATGTYALQSNTTAFYNTATGYSALQNNTTGGDNTATGNNALKANTTGFYNTATGSHALETNTNGNENVAYGYNSLQANTSGYDNTAVGTYSMSNNTTGYNNTAIGLSTLNNNTTGVENTAIGFQSLDSNTTGSANTATGTQSLQANTTGFNNTANGFKALYANTTGIRNTAIGREALANNISGEKNNAVGTSSLLNNVSGSYNNAFGFETLLNNTGSNNLALGDEAGYKDYDSTGNATFLQQATLSNSTAIGSNAISQMDHALILGNIGSGTYDAGVYTGQTYVGIGTTKPSNLFSVSPVYYNTGTAYQSTTTITGVGTTWTSAMVGMQFIFADGSSAPITGFTNTTTLTTSTSQTVSSNPGISYRIHTVGLQVENTSGNVGIGTTSPQEKLHIDGVEAGIRVSRSGAQGFIQLQRTGTATAGDMVGLVDFLGDNSSSTRTSFAQIQGVDSDPTDTAEKGALKFFTRDGASIAERMRIDSSGNVGIGNTTAGYLLHVGDASLTSGTSVARFENAGGTCTVTPDVAGGITCTSDIRLKKDISSVDSAVILDKLLGLDAISYHMNAESSTDQLHTGFSAQQLEAVLPDLVVTDKNGYKSVSYAGLTPYLVSALQEQQKQIVDIQSSSNNLSTDGIIQGNLSVDGNLNLNGLLTTQTLTVTGNATFAGDVSVAGNLTTATLTVNGHIITGGNTPTIIPGIAAGAGATANIEGNDTTGTITITTDSNITNTDGLLANVNFSNAFNKLPKVVISPANRDSAKLGVYYDRATSSVSQFNLLADSNLQPNKTYVFTYWIAE